MAFTESYKRYIEEQLIEFGEFTSKRMFGGVGFFREKVMFGGIMDGIFRLKADDHTKADFEAYGMEYWGAEMKGKKMKMPYYTVPEEVVQNKAELREWALRAFEVALKAKKK